MAQTSRSIRIDAAPARPPARTTRVRAPDRRTRRATTGPAESAAHPVHLAWQGLPRELRDSYSMVDYLGKGATSVVFRAIQEELGREVVVKVLADVEDETRERSSREAMILARIRHQNVIRLFDFGDQPNLIYLVLEYLPGCSMASWGPHDRPDGERILELALGIAQGLSAIHDAGVVHRDVKPSNIWITDEGVPKILDFGLARDLGHERTSPEGSFLGTLSHAAPEQIEGDPIDGRSDLYSLGVILYQMITGKNPFIGENVAETIGRHLGMRISRLPSGGPALPSGLERLVVDLLQKDPGRRPASAHDVVKRLEAMRRASVAVAVGAVEARSRRRERPAPSIHRLAAASLRGLSGRRAPFKLEAKRLKLVAFVLAMMPTVLGIVVAAMRP